MIKVNKTLTLTQSEELLVILKNRFYKNENRHQDIDWEKVQVKLELKPEKLWSLNEMEITGGEPDVVGYNQTNNEFIFYDCVPDSPKGRRSLCYDHEALNSRKEHKPKHSAVEMALEMGVELLSEQEYRALQEMGEFDLKTSSWIKTPAEMRKLGGALFCDRRFNRVFVYHNGAESYYGGRGFRGSLRV